MTILEELAAETFDPLVDQTFHVEVPAGTTVLKLIEVTRYGKRRPSHVTKRHEPFSLIFERVSGPEMGSGLCRLSHAALQVDSLFLNRVQQPPWRHSLVSYYEAAFG